MVPKYSIFDFEEYECIHSALLMCITKWGFTEVYNRRRTFRVLKVLYVYTK